MLGIPWGHNVDVWSFGCLVAEVLLGVRIFESSTVEGVLARQQAVCGAIPMHMLEKCPSVSRMFFTSKGQTYQVDPSGMPPGAYLLVPRREVTLYDLLRDKVDDPEFIKFISASLCIDPALRLSAKQLLQHTWLVGARQGE